MQYKNVFPTILACVEILCLSLEEDSATVVVVGVDHLELDAGAAAVEHQHAGVPPYCHCAAASATGGQL